MKTIKLNITEKKRKEIQEKRFKLKCSPLGSNHDLKTRLFLYKAEKHYKKTGEFVWFEDQL